MFEAFFKHNKSADTSVTILEGVDALKLNMELNNIFKLYILFAVIIGKKFFLSADTFSGSVVSLPPTSLGNFL